MYDSIYDSRTCSFELLDIIAPAPVGVARVPKKKFHINHTNGDDVAPQRSMTQPRPVCMRQRSAVDQNAGPQGDRPGGSILSL